MKTSIKRSVIAIAAALISAQAFAVQTKSAGGFYHNLFVNDAGDVYASGNNRLNQVGAMKSKEPVYSGSTFLINRDVKYLTPVHTGLVNVKAVAAAGYRSAALKKDGTVYFWGLVSQFNASSPLDSYTTTVPQLVNLTGVIDIAMSGSKLLLLKEGLTPGAGTVYEWSFVPNSVPTKVAGLPEDSITSIAAATRFGLRGEAKSGPAAMLDHYRVLTNSGDVYVWGTNDKGQLGLGDFVDRTSPVKQSSDAKAIGVGPSTGFTITSGGYVYQSGWFSFNAYQPGKAQPVKVANAFGVDVVYGTSTGAFATTDGGNVYAWGWHNYIGAGGNLRNDAAIIIPEIGTQAVDLGVGNETVTVLYANGNFNTIGGNAHGQIGDGSYIENHAFPHKSLIAAGTIASVQAQLQPTQMNWVDPEALAIRTCLENSDDVLQCDPSYANIQKALADNKELLIQNAALQLQISALKAQLANQKAPSCSTANNGFGNGDQGAPGKSATKNNAENALDDHQ